MSADTRDAKQHTILVVEDDERMRQSLRDRLRGDGYQVIVASDVDEGLKELQQQAVDLVLLDLRLGDKSGLDFMDEMKDNDAIDEKSTIVVVLTAIADPAMIGDVIGRGPADYLVKADNSLDDISLFIRKKFTEDQ